MKKRLSIILAMTVFTVSLPGVPAEAAEDAVILEEVESQPETVETIEEPKTEGNDNISESTEDSDDTEIIESTESPDDTEVSEPTDFGYPSDIISDADLSTSPEVPDDIESLTIEFSMLEIPTVLASTPEEISVSDVNGLLDAQKQVNNLADGTTYYSISLNADIDFATAGSGTAWSGFGTSEKPFRGSFDGKGHTITMPSGSEALFYHTQNATIENVIVKGADVRNAGIVATMKGGTVKNCGNLANVQISENSRYAGGIVGYAINTESSAGAILDCWNGENVSSSADPGKDDYGYAGGIVGYIDRTAGSAGAFAVKGCNNFGKVSGYYAGGIVGKITDNVTVKDAYNSGEVKGTVNAGGIVGVIAGYASLKELLDVGKVTGVKCNPLYTYDGDGLASKVVIRQMVYDSTVNAGDYVWGTSDGTKPKSITPMPTEQLLQDGIHWIVASESEEDTMDATQRAWHMSAFCPGYYPICISNDENRTFSDKIANVATSAATIVKDGDKKYLCLFSKAITADSTDNYYNTDTVLEQFKDADIGKDSITYRDGEYTREIPLTETGRMTVIYGMYDSSYQIELAGTFENPAGDNDLYAIPYGTKVDSVISLENTNQENEQFIADDIILQSELTDIKLGQQENSTTGKDDPKLTGQITAVPSDSIYTITVAVKENKAFTTWCVKKLQVKVIKATAAFDWKVNGGDNVFRDATYNNSPYVVEAVRMYNNKPYVTEAARIDGNDNTGVVEPKVSIIYKDNTGNQLSEAPKNAGNYTVEMQPDAGTTGHDTDTTKYYEYSCPKNTSFTINPKKLTYSKNSDANGYTIALARNEIIIEGTDWKTEDTQNTVAIQDEDLDQTLVKDIDFTVIYSNTSEPGTATVTIEGKGNYHTIQPIELSYQIKEVLSTDMFHFTDASKTIVILGKDSQKKLPVTGTGRMTGKTLDEGEDYTVSYGNTDRPGTATVTIQGGSNGKYIIKEDKLVTLQYSVKKLLTKDMFVLENTDPVTLGEGNEQKKVTGTDKEFRPEESLVQGKDYTLTYSGTDKPGTATVMVHAVENSDYVTDQDNPIQFRYNIMLGSSKAELDTGSYKLGNPGMWYLKEQPGVHYYGEIDFYVPGLRNYQFFHVGE